ncbi:MAG TPA: glutaminyl-peptide cyclotransferase [Pyrinomonadaceae bacterium]|nr:glutaminyl-peptide cyclotransferase [Pyrinomonadaceae bacterium]
MRFYSLIALLLVLFLLACGEQSATARGVPVYTYEVVNNWHHDPEAYTQGLIFYDGFLYESTGLNGQSSLRKVDLTSGKVIQQVKVPEEFFAEGMTIFRGRIFQLTWKHNKGFIYNLEDFQKAGEFTYEGEGWGLTHDDESLIMSDGTSRIRFLDPTSFKVKRTINVTDSNHPITELNELEYIRGEIYANIWETDRIARIDPRTGKVTGWIDLTGLLHVEDSSQPVDVLNGIAYDTEHDRLFVTGKLWPKLFEIRFKKAGH